MVRTPECPGYRLTVYPDDLGDVNEPSRTMPNRFPQGFPDLEPVWRS